MPLDYMDMDLSPPLSENVGAIPLHHDLSPPKWKCWSYSPGYNGKDKFSFSDLFEYLIFPKKLKLLRKNIDIRKIDKIARYCCHLNSILSNKLDRN